MGIKIVSDFWGNPKPVTDEKLFPYGTTPQAGGKDVVVSKSASFSVAAEDSGTTFLVTAADVVASLPATVKGLKYTFVTAYVAAGSTGFSVSPVAADLIYANPSVVNPADNKDLINTIASAYIGDSVTLVGDGSNGWFATAVRGTWARQG